MSLPVPLTPAELTAEWLTGALQEHGCLGGGSVTSVGIEEIGVGRGYIGLTLRLRPGYANAPLGAPASLVVKLPTFVEITNPQDRMLINLLYRSEISFYQSLATECPVRIPRFYWGGMDEAANRFCLLMEDLGDLRQSSQVEGCTAEEARMIVQHLARLHARWWGGAEIASQPWLMPGDMAAILLSGLVQSGWAPFWLAMKDQLPPEFEAIGEKIAQQYATLGMTSGQSSRTLTHGDFRVENFLFGEPGSRDELVIIDWQLLSSGSGLYDLAYFISQSLPTDTRRAHEAELKRLYYDTLCANGVTGYDFETCERDYRLNLLAAMAVPVNGVRTAGEYGVEGAGGDLSAEDRVLLERAIESGLALVTAMTQRCVTAILDNLAQELLA